MGDPYKKLKSGALVTDMSRTAYNDMLDMLRWWKTQANRTGRGPIKDIVDWDQSIFLVKNNSGGDIGYSYAVLGIDDPLYGPDDNEQEFLNFTSFSGVVPTVADHSGGKWCVCLEPSTGGSLCKALFSGVVPVRVYVTAKDDVYCDVIEPQTVGSETCYLGTGGRGSQILWMPDNAEPETIVWAIIRLGHSEGLQTFELKEDKTPGTEALAYRLDSTGEADTSADTFYVYDQVGGKQWRALGRDTVTAGGARGVCWTNSQSGNREIVQMAEQAKWCWATTTVAVATGDATFTVDNVTAGDGGQAPDYDTTLEVSNDPDAYNIPNGTRGKIMWDESSSAWHPFDYRC